MARMPDPRLWRDPRTGIWHIRLFLRGRRRSWSTEKTEERAAKKVLGRFKDELLQGRKRRSLRRPSRQPAVRLGDFTIEVLAYYRATSAEKTAEAVRTALMHLRASAGDLRLEEIDTAVLERLRQRLLEAGCAKKTVNNYLGCVSAALGYAKRLRYLKRVPRLERLHLDRRLPRFLSVEEQAQLLSACAAAREGLPLPVSKRRVPRARKAQKGRPGPKPGQRVTAASRSAWAKLECFLWVALNTGMRPGEVCALTWADVDVLGGMVRVRATKNGEDRVVPLHPQLQAYLAGIPRSEPRVVRLVTRRARRLFNALVQSLGWQDVRPHTTRHTFASHAAMNGVPLDTLRRWLGHSDLRTLQIYSHISDEHSKAEMARLPGLPTGNKPATQHVAELWKQQAPAAKARSGKDLSWSGRPDLNRRPPSPE